jgi:hypothetical protein
MKAVALEFNGAHSTKTFKPLFVSEGRGVLIKHTSESLHSRIITGKFEKSCFQASRCQVVAHGSAPAC